MFKELEELKLLVAKADEQADNALRELRKKCEEGKRLEERYEELLNNGGSISEISSVKQEISRLKNEVDILQEMAKKMDAKRFKYKDVRERHTMLRPVRDAFKREVEETNQKIEPVLDELRGQLAKTFQTILKANALYKTAEQKISDLNSTELQLGLNPINSMHVTDIRGLLNQYVDEAVMAYYRGKTPEWIQQYEKSK